MKKYSLLYVDDEESNLRIFKDTFRRKFNVHTAISAKEGMKILDKHTIDLVLSDQRMPEMSGVEFLQYTLERFPEPNRILITGYSDIDAIENAINYAHIFQYVQKPWDEEKLLKIIENALKVYHLEKENAKQKEELQIAKEKAENSDRLKTVFINNLSHEIRTPMNGIMGFSSLLSDQDLTKEECNKYVNIIQNSSERLLRVIDDLLEISRLETKQIPIVESDVCLNKFLEDLYEIFRIDTEKRKIFLKLHKGLPDHSSLVHLDESKLNKTLSNLIENAIKYTLKGGVEFGYKQEGDYIEFFVKDTGIGIRAEKHDAIFERFLQDEQDYLYQTDGLGLGLAIVKENVELLGGKIKLQSEKEKGTTFFVKIPYKISIAQNNKAISKVKNNIPSTNYTILVCEDIEENHYFLEILLKEKIKLDCDIIKAQNGIEAIDACKKNAEIDLVLMDIKMPIMDGFEATKSIKKFRPNLPIIAQTAYSTPTDIDKAKAAGCDDSISKPINYEDLVLTIGKHLTIK